MMQLDFLTKHPMTFETYVDGISKKATCRFSNEPLPPSGQSYKTLNGKLQL